MKQFIQVITILMVLVIAGAGGSALAGEFKVAYNSGSSIIFDALATVSNTSAELKHNGVTDRVFTIFSNSSSATVSMWLQHAKDTEAKGGVFVNAVSTAMVFNPADSDSYAFQGNIKLLPYVRWHTEDSDITTNNVTAELWAW